MSIIKAIETAYAKMNSRGWDRLYFAIDIHDTFLKSNYETGQYEFINQDSLDALRMLSDRDDTFIILWSSMYEHDVRRLETWLANQGVFFEFFNRNPEEVSTDYACFDKKFYFSVLIDDKAGFDPDTDWKKILEFYQLPND